MVRYSVDVFSVLFFFEINYVVVKNTFDLINFYLNRYVIDIAIADILYNCGNKFIAILIIKSIENFKYFYSNKQIYVSRLIQFWHILVLLLKFY